MEDSDVAASRPSVPSAPYDRLRSAVASNRLSVSLSAVPESEMVPVIVKELTGKTMDLQAPLSASITTLKQDICASNDLHPEPYKQKLLFRNAILEDGPHSLGE